MWLPQVICFLSETAGTTDSKIRRKAQRGRKPELSILLVPVGCWNSHKPSNAQVNIMAVSHKTLLSSWMRPLALACPSLVSSTDVQYTRSHPGDISCERWSEFNWPDSAHCGYGIR